jgi:hypothetical protein
MRISQRENERHEAFFQFSQDFDLGYLFELVLLIVLVLDPPNQIRRLPHEWTTAAPARPPAASTSGINI